MKEAKQAKLAAQKLLVISEADRNRALKNIALKLREKSQEIIAENKKDIEAGKAASLSSALIDRLLLTEDRVESLAKSVESITTQEQVVNQIESEFKREDGLVIQKQRVPIGVLAMIFESRPNVVIDCSALAIKSGNAIILKGGKEAHYSNLILSQLVTEAIESILPDNSVQLVTSRDDVNELLTQVEYVDLIIPRGGEGLINHVVQNSKVPVLAHYKGLCHIYIDETADLESAKAIILNAKVQRPGVCNAMETLLLSKNLPSDFVSDVLASLYKEGVEVRVCDKTMQTDFTKQATEQDWATEYLDKILSVKTVDDVAKACEHIQEFGSHHTEAIISSDPKAINYFQSNVDASSVMINASTRFNDGGEFGLGAELGISTTKIHSYGPMGAKEMTILRHLVVGSGQVRK